MAWSVCQSPFWLTDISRLTSWHDLQELDDAPQAARAVSAGAQSAAATIAGAASASTIDNHRLDCAPQPPSRVVHAHTASPPRIPTGDLAVNSSAAARLHHNTSLMCKGGPGNRRAPSRVAAGLRRPAGDAGPA